MISLRRLVLVTFLIGLVCGVVFTVTIGTMARPNCPSEDSCYADYSGGAWHIIPGDRP